MAGFIVLEDGRAYSAANWAYDATVEAIAEALPTNTLGEALRDWLLEQRCSVQGPGLGSVDIRELTTINKDLLIVAIEEAYRRQKVSGPTDWTSPEYWPDWLARFADLVKMVELIRRGESPEQFNPHMRDVIPPTGERAGPGWDDG